MDPESLNEMTDLVRGFLEGCVKGIRRTLESKGLSMDDIDEVLTEILIDNLPNPKD